MIDLEKCIWEIVSCHLNCCGEPITKDEILDVFTNPSSYELTVMEPNISNFIRRSSFSTKQIENMIAKICKENKYGIYCEDGLYYIPYSNLSPWQMIFELHTARFHMKLKKYTKKDILKMCDWNSNTPVKPKYVVNVGDWDFPCSSDNEYYVVKTLVESGYTKVIRGQHFPISITNKRNYYPDVIILDKHNHIFFIEVKPVYDMIESLNIKKYEKLKEFCINNGYGYMMLDKEFTPFETFIANNECYDTLYKPNPFSDVDKKVYKMLSKNKEDYKEDINTIIKELKWNHSEEEIKERIAYILWKEKYEVRGTFSGSKTIRIKKH